jgi:hypothetical protein
MRSASAIFIAFVGAVGAIQAAENREPPIGESSVEIRQRLIDTGMDDETTVIEVVVRNKGNLAVEDVSVRGPMPKGHHIRTATPPVDKNAIELKWSLDRLAAGEERKIRLQFAPAPDGAGADLKVELRVGFRGGAASVLQAPVKQLPPRFTIAVPATATVGVPAPVKIQIANGQRAVRGVVLQASLGAGLSHVGGRELENDLGPFEAGQTRAVRLETIPTKGGELRGKIRVRSEGSGWAEQEFTLSVREIGLAVSTSAPPAAEVKALVPLTMGVSNDGAEAARRVRLLVRLPSGLIHESSPGGTYVADEHFVLFDLGDLKPGEKRAMRVTLKAALPGEQAVRAILSSEAGEPHANSVAIQVGNGTMPTPPMRKGP